MEAKQHPSGSTFVIRVEKKRGGSPVSETLAPLGEVSELESGGLVQLQVAEEGDAKETWQRARKLLGGAWVQPVLLDDHGNPSYPTGEVTVRFKHDPTDKELREFSRAHGLSFKRRNEFVREQAVFEPVEGEETYLPELVEKIARDKKAKRAWANTLGRYIKHKHEG